MHYSFNLRYNLERIGLKLSNPIHMDLSVLGLPTTSHGSCINFANPVTNDLPTQDSHREACFHLVVRVEEEK